MEVFDDPKECLLAWRRVFDALENGGVRVVLRRLEVVPRRGTSGLARSSPFVPKGTALYSFSGPKVRRRQRMRSRPGLPPCRRSSPPSSSEPSPCSIGPFGGTGFHPAGCGGSVDDNVLLQVLPLALACLWSPPDPQRVLELLTLPVGPVRKDVAFRLVPSASGMACRRK